MCHEQLGRNNSHFKERVQHVYLAIEEMIYHRR
jgi:hypothetical protein